MRKILTLVVGLIFTSVSFSDEYSDALEAEASGVVIETEKEVSRTDVEKKSQSDWSFAEQSLQSGLPTNLQHKQFEKVLKKLYYGTYAFYLKLTVAQANGVYEEYQKGLDIEKLREVIMENYKKNL